MNDQRTLQAIVEEYERAFQDVWLEITALKHALAALGRELETRIERLEARVERLEAGNVERRQSPSDDDHER